MNRTRTGRTRGPRRHRLVSLIALAGLILSTGCGSVFPTLRPVSSQGTIIYHQYIVVMILSTIVFLIVFGLLGWILLHYRGNEGDDEPNQTSGNKALEITWITIPVVMLIGLFIYSAVNMRSVEANDSSALQINVIGHQWWWEYQYPSLGIDTASELHLPVGTPVRLNITGADVIHSFWVPDLGWKMDAIPGKSNPMNLNLTKTGTFDGSCAEFCGSEHAWMRIRVISQNQSDFNSWVSMMRSPSPQPTSALEKQGEQIFNSSTCVSCHVFSRVGPSLTHLGSRQWLGSGVIDNTPQNLANWIMNVQNIKPGALMPDFHYSPDQLKALVAYLEGQK